MDATNLIQDIPIAHFLPHRAPMLMVDRIWEISKEHVLCSFLIAADNIFVEEGQFTEMGLVEHMAQVCSAIVGQTFFDENHQSIGRERVIGFISGIKSLQILALPAVGEDLQTNSSLHSQFDGDDFSICTMHVSAFVNKVEVANAEINLFLKTP